MVIIRKRVVAIKPVEAPPPVPVKKPGPIRRNAPSAVQKAPILKPGFRVDPDAREAPERNADGTSYTETIARYMAKVHNPLTAIRAKCVECSGGSLKEVSQCLVHKCALFPFRMGSNPMHKKTRDRLAKEE